MNSVRERLFIDRKDAAKKLIFNYEDNFTKDQIFLGIPNGGIVIAAEVAKQFQKKITVIISRKIPLEDMAVIGLGAVTQSNVILNNTRISDLNVDGSKLSKAISVAKQKVKYDEMNFSEYLPAEEDICGKEISIFDDGISSGYTLIAAVKELIAYHPGKISVFTPIIHTDAMHLCEQYDININSLYEASNKRFVIDDYYDDFEDVNSRFIID